MAAAAHQVAPDALAWARAAVDGIEAMSNLGVLMVQTGLPGIARTWWTRAATGGHTFALSALAQLLDQLGERAEAARWRTRPASDENAPGT
ncbi:hypothetical protein [Streptomyces lydicus]|uniref:hypothetical protein n=1 Tax=Streptomyces lydicus TaxID=47763 RepID=UPI0036F8ACF0